MRALIVVGAMVLGCHPGARDAPPRARPATVATTAPAAMSAEVTASPANANAVAALEARAEEIAAGSCSDARVAFDKAKANVAIDSPSVSAAIDADAELSARRQKALLSIIARMESCSAKKKP